MPADPRATCIIGVARRTWHPSDAPDGAPEPLAMWEQVARDAAADTGAADASSVLGALESIDIVYSQSWQYDDAVARLAERVGASPARRRYSGIGGSVPLVLATEVAQEIRAGHLDLALITGAEALATVRRLKKAGEKPQWSFRPAEKRPFPMDMDFDPSEITHAVFEAYLTFALFDNARRAHLGRGLDEHRARLGRVLAPMTEIAAASPHAWFPVARSADEIVTATPDNRMVAYPYTKLMTSIMDVDMAAALVLASAAKADALGVPEERRVYLRGAGYAEDPAHVAGHPELWRSPAMAAAAQAALAGAGIGADDVAHFDLYSCFASSVCFALDALGISEDDTARRDADGRVAVPRRARLQLHDARTGGHGRDAAPRPRLLRRDERRRHAHAEARLRGVVDRPRDRAPPPRRRPPPLRPTRWPSSSRPKAMPRWRPTRSCTVVTAGPNGPC